MDISVLSSDFFIRYVISSSRLPKCSNPYLFCSVQSGHHSMQSNWTVPVNALAQSIFHQSLTAVLVEIRRPIRHGPQVRTYICFRNSGFTIIPSPQGTSSAVSEYVWTRGAVLFPSLCCATSCEPSDDAYFKRNDMYSTFHTTLVGYSARTI
jgi:hypothetical protein